MGLLRGFYKNQNLQEKPIPEDLSPPGFSVGKLRLRK
jgi:hypothetical protein